MTKQDFAAITKLVLLHQSKYHATCLVVEVVSYVPPPHPSSFVIKYHLNLLSLASY